VLAVLLAVVNFVWHTFSFKFNLKVLVGGCVFDLVILQVLQQLGEHVGSLVSAEELSVFARLVLKFARLKHCLGDTRVLALLDCILNVQVDLVAHFVTTANTALGMLLCTLNLVSFSLLISHLNDALMSN